MKNFLLSYIYIYIPDSTSKKKGIIYEVEELVLIENEVN